MAFGGAFQGAFRAPFADRERNGLLNNLIAFWPGNEVSGNALDLHTNGLTLTDGNTVTSNPGKVYALARQYTATNSEYHYRLGDDALLSTGDLDYTLAAWMWLDDKDAGYYGPGKWVASAGNREYRWSYSNTSDRWRWQVSPDGSATTSLLADSGGAASLSTWYLCIGWHDSVANQICVQINNGTVDSTAHASGYDSGSSFRISNTGGYYNGRIGPTMFWKSAAGGGGVLTTAQRNALWNQGIGLPYARFTT